MIDLKCVNLRYCVIRMHPLNSVLLLLHLAFEWLEWWSGGSAGTRTLGWIGCVAESGR